MSRINSAAAKCCIPASSTLDALETGPSTISIDDTHGPPIQSPNTGAPTLSHTAVPFWLHSSSAQPPVSPSLHPSSATASSYPPPIPSTPSLDGTALSWNRDKKGFLRVLCPKCNLWINTGARHQQNIRPLEAHMRGRKCNPSYVSESRIHDGSRASRQAAFGSNASTPTVPTTTPHLHMPLGPSPHASSVTRQEVILGRQGAMGVETVTATGLSVAEILTPEDFSENGEYTS